MELIDEMIADAWYMVTEYHLNLGPNNTLETLALYMQKERWIKSADKKDTILDYMKNTSDPEYERGKEH